MSIRVRGGSTTNRTTKSPKTYKNMERLSSFTAAMIETNHHSQCTDEKIQKPSHNDHHGLNNIFGGSADALVRSPGRLLPLKNQREKLTIPHLKTYDGGGLLLQSPLVETAALNGLLHPNNPASLSCSAPSLLAAGDGVSGGVVVAPRVSSTLTTTASIHSVLTAPQKCSPSTKMFLPAGVMPHEARERPPSECSSMNSSITGVPSVKGQMNVNESIGDEEEKEGVHVEVKQDEKQIKQKRHRGKKKRRSEDKVMGNPEDVNCSTLYNEVAEAESEAIQQCLVNRDALINSKKDTLNHALTQYTTFEVLPKELLDMENTKRKTFCTSSLPKESSGDISWDCSVSLTLPSQRVSQPFGSHKLHGMSKGITEELCRSMSLYNAFSLDEGCKTWIVNHHVLTRCMNYVGLMGYERLMRSPHKEVRNPLDLSWEQLVSPITRASFGPMCEDGKIIHSRRWVLRSLYDTKMHSNTSTLFLRHHEAERWFLEQEYVIGTILSCCAWTHRNNTSGEIVPYLNPMSHPIIQSFAFILKRFPHWGDTTAFLEMWENQVELVLGTPIPSHQRLFSLQEDHIFFSSDMEGGNLARVERVRGNIKEPTFNLWLEPDPCLGQRIWFRFAIAGLKPDTSICLRLVNIQPTTKLYVQNGMRPVWRAGTSPRLWTPVSQCIFRTTNKDTDGELTFWITPHTNDVVHVAFCSPYTYADLLCHIAHWHHLVKRSVFGIRFEERVLCRTLDGRKLHLLIITGISSNNILARNKRHGNDTSGLSRQLLVSPYIHFEGGKKIVLLTARVHSGEVTASHAIHGAISFLLSGDPLAALLREYFIFYIVPMLNPDGVARGYSRVDQNGLNLNRCYKNPIPKKQPTVSALRGVFEHLKHTFRHRFFMYMDFHSHASQSSGFIFGNHLPATLQHWNMMFPRIVSLHAQDIFSFQLCRFGRGHMTSKEGSSRVLFGESLIHSYTVELPYFSNNRMYVDGASGNDGRILTTTNSIDSDQLRETRNVISLHTNRRACVSSCGTKISSTKHARVSKVGRILSRNHSELRRRTNNNNCNTTAATTTTMATIPKRERSGAGGDSIGNSDVILRYIEVPCVLSQSAEVGRACLVGLLDYCDVTSQISSKCAVRSGLDRMLRDVKRNVSTTSHLKTAAYNMHFTCRPN